MRIISFDASSQFNALFLIQFDSHAQVRARIMIQNLRDKAMRNCQCQSAGTLLLCYIYPHVRCTTFPQYLYVRTRSSGF